MRITSDIPRLRDPFILRVGGTYYAYGTGWVYYKCESGDLRGPWVGPTPCVEKPDEADDQFWAPEVHEYRGAFYLFTTYHSSVTGHRGCSVFRAERPEGPFRELRPGHTTPKDWDSIDGTLYVDPEGKPWMVFVHEWTCTPDGVGRFAAMRLSDDLSEAAGEPVELFRADDPVWAARKVTDGCFMYRTSSGRLLMLWSNWDDAGYCVGIAHSEDGTITGRWIQEEKRLYSRSMTGDFDGGHGMLFRGPGDRLYLSMHSPNDPRGGRKETPVFLPVREQGDTLVWDAD